MTIRLEVPGWASPRIDHLVLDMNGTIAFAGAPVHGLAEALGALGGAVEVLAVTADTHGTAAGLRDGLGIGVHVIEPGDEAVSKRDLVCSLGADRVVAMGNGANDALMLGEAALGVCVLGREGAAVDALQAADVVFADPLDAIAALASPRRLVATLRR